MANDELSAGFTGTPAEPPAGVRKIAKAATGAVSREANAAVVGAADGRRRFLCDRLYFGSIVR